MLSLPPVAVRDMHNDLLSRLLVFSYLYFQLLFYDNLEKFGINKDAYDKYLKIGNILTQLI